MHISTGGVITCVIPVLVYSHGHPYHVLSEYGATMANHELPSHTWRLTTILSQLPGHLNGLSRCGMGLYQVTSTVFKRSFMTVSYPAPRISYSRTSLAPQGLPN